MAAKHKPLYGDQRAWWSTKPANAASRRGLQAAMAALYSDAPAPSCEDALALREQWQQEDEARRTGQGCLPLRPST